MARGRRTEAYERAMAFGERVWALVDGWPAFARATLGRPLVRAADAVAAAARTGRPPHGGPAARTALAAAATWLAKAHRRGLIAADAYAALRRDVAAIERRLGPRRRIGPAPPPASNRRRAPP